MNDSTQAKFACDILPSASKVDDDLADHQERAIVSRGHWGVKSAATNENGFKPESVTMPA